MKKEQIAILVPGIQDVLLFDLSLQQSAQDQTHLCAYLKTKAEERIKQFQMSNFVLKGYQKLIRILFSITLIFQNTRSRLSRISLPSHPSHPQNHDSDIPCSSCNSPQSLPWSVRSRPNSCDAYSQFREQSASPSRHGQERNQSFSTIRRTHSPFRSISSSDSTYKSDRQDIRLTARPPSVPRKPVHTNKPPVLLPPTTRDTAWPVLQIKEDQGEVWKKNLNLPNFNFGPDDMSKLKLIIFTVFNNEEITPCVSHTRPGE